MEFIEATVDSIRVSLGNEQKVIFLREKDKNKLLPIWINEFGADSISTVLQGVQLPRPNTHDFIINIINNIGCSLKNIVIISLENDTYYARAIFDFDGMNYDVDCMPSDAIAIALRTNAPIFIAKELLANAVDEHDIK